MGESGGIVKMVVFGGIILAVVTGGAVYWLVSRKRSKEDSST